MKTGKLKRLSACGLAAVTSLLSLSGCGSKDDDKQYKIFVIGQTKNMQFWDDLQAGAMDASEELGYKVTYDASTDITKTTEQADLIDRAIEEKYDAICIAPDHATALNDKLSDAYNAGLKIFTIDADVSNFDNRISYIGTQNSSAGSIAAREAMQILLDAGPDARAAIVCHSESASSAQQRVSGFTSELNKLMNVELAKQAAQQGGEEGEDGEDGQEGQEGQEGQQGGAPQGQGNAQKGGAPQGQGNAQQGGAPQGQGNAQQGGAPQGQGAAQQGEGGAQGGPPAGATQGGPPQQTGENFVVATTYCDGTRIGAQEMAADIIKRNPDVKVLYATNENSTVGVCLAVKEANMQGKIAVIGFNSNQQEIDDLNAGVLTGTMLQSPYNMGYFGVFYCGQYLAELDVIEKSDNPERRPTIPPSVDTGAIYVTKDRLNDGDIQLLLNPYIFDTESDKNSK